MNTNATPEDRITAWLLSDAPPQAPDRLLEDTFEQTRRIRRRGSPYDWRIFSMMRNIAVVATAAVVVLALVLVGGGLLDRTPGVGSPPASTAPSALPGGPSPSASGTAASVGPTDNPQPSGPQAFEDVPGGGKFEPGTYTISSIAPLEISFTVPGGWERPPNAPEFLGPTGQTGREIGGLSFWTPTKFYADPCRSSDDYIVELPADASVTDTTRAVIDLPEFETTPPEDVTVSGYAGKYFQMTSPCSDVAWGRFWILEVEGVRLVMMAHLWSEYASNPDAVAELEAIVDSVRIERSGTQP